MEATAGKDLTRKERTILGLHEKNIAEGQKSFVSVGKSLKQIRDGLLYRETHETFEAYCEGRWDLERGHAYRLIRCAEVYQRCGQLAAPPKNEAQCRALAALPEDEQAEAWREAIESAPNGKVTAAHVASVVERRQPADPPAFQPNVLHVCQKISRFVEKCLEEPVAKPGEVAEFLRTLADRLEARK